MAWPQLISHREHRDHGELKRYRIANRATRFLLQFSLCELCVLCGRNTDIRTGYRRSAAGRQRECIVRIRRSWDRIRRPLAPPRPPPPPPSATCLAASIASARRRRGASKCFWPSFSQRSSFSRPSINTDEPLLRYSLATSAVRLHSVTSTKVTSSTHWSPRFTRSFTARPISETGVPLGMYPQFGVAGQIADQNHTIVAGHGWNSFSSRPREASLRRSRLLAGAEAITEHPFRNGQGSKLGLDGQVLWKIRRLLNVDFLDFGHADHGCGNRWWWGSRARLGGAPTTASTRWGWISNVSCQQNSVVNFILAVEPRDRRTRRAEIDQPVGSPCGDRQLDMASRRLFHSRLITTSGRRRP